MPQDTIRLERLKITCIIGCNPSERIHKQTLVVDVELVVDTSRAGRSDNIRDTNDYSDINKRVRTLCENAEPETIKRLCALVARHVLGLPAAPGSTAAEVQPGMLAAVHASSRTPLIQRVKVKIEKPDALKGTAIPSVTIERDRVFFEAEDRLMAEQQAAATQAEAQGQCTAASWPAWRGRVLAILEDELRSLPAPSQHCLIRQGSAEYVHTMDGIKHRAVRLRQPCAVVRADSILAVQAVMRWATQNGVTVSVVGGGHSGHCAVTARPGSMTMALSLAGLARMDVDVASGTVTAQGGATSGAIEHALAPHGLFVPLGSRPSVGMGLALPGGMGHTTRTHGLACDKIVQAQVVLASGELLTVTDEAHPELMQGIRGAGPALCVVVAVTFAAHPFSP